ncbi:hypothetical protein MYIN104542_30490 [Mycobacterium intermedium]
MDSPTPPTTKSTEGPVMTIGLTTMGPMLALRLSPAKASVGMVNSPATMLPREPLTGMLTGMLTSRPKEIGGMVRV